MVLLIIILLSIITVFLYMRYVPVRGVQCMNSLNPDDESIKIVDVRDYNQSYKNPIRKSVNIPVAYMKRNYQEISNPIIHIIASNQLEKNISIRFLRRKGFKINGYSFTSCKCDHQTQAAY